MAGKQLTHVDLDVRERRQLDAAEADIRKAGSLLDGALKLILDRKLYRFKADNFDDYCQNVWGWSGRHVRRFIAHQQTIRNLFQVDERQDVALITEAPILTECENGQQVGPIGQIPSEAATRELAGLPPAEQREVYAAASDNGKKKPTAKDVKKAKNSQPKEDKRTSFDVAAIEGKSASVVKDELEREVPSKLTKAHALAAELVSIGSKLDQVKKLVREAAEQEGSDFLPVQQIEIALKDVKGLITQSRYWTACPRKHSGGKCDRCDGHGYLPFSRRGQLSQEDKESLGL